MHDRAFALLDRHGDRPAWKPPLQVRHPRMQHLGPLLQRLVLDPSVRRLQVHRMLHGREFFGRLGNKCDRGRDHGSVVHDPIVALAQVDGLGFGLGLVLSSSDAFASGEPNLGTSMTVGEITAISSLPALASTPIVSMAKHVITSALAVPAGVQPMSFRPMVVRSMLEGSRTPRSRRC